MNTYDIKLPVDRLIFLAINRFITTCQKKRDRLIELLVARIVIYYENEY